MSLYYVLLAVIMIASVLLVLVVLVQNSKGGGLASNFSGQNQYMGVRKTSDFLENATWVLAVSIIVLSLIVPFSQPKRASLDDDVLLIDAQELMMENQGGITGPAAQAPTAE